MYLEALDPAAVPAHPAEIVLDPAAADAGTRCRLSGPALRTFANLAARWQLSETERVRLLGRPSRSTYYGWLDKAGRRQPVTLSLDTLLRLSALFGIHKGLGILFATEGEALTWLRSPNSGPVFGGQRPLDLLTSGTQDGLLLVRRYIDAWRGGIFAAPGPGEAATEPAQGTDIIIVDDRRRRGH